MSVKQLNKVLRSFKWWIGLQRSLNLILTWTGIWFWHLDDGYILPQISSLGNSFHLLRYRPGRQARELSQILRGIIEAPGEQRRMSVCGMDDGQTGAICAEWCMICVTLHYQHTLPHSGLDNQLTNDNKSGIVRCYHTFPYFWQLTFRILNRF